MNDFVIKKSMWSITRRVVAVVLVMTLIAPALVGFTEKAYATGDPTNPTNGEKALARGYIACAAGGFAAYWLGKMMGMQNRTSVETGSGTLDWKGVLFDCLAWVINNVLIDQITNATIDWINKGFDGNPSYIDNFDAFLEKASDDAALTYLQGTNLEFLCSPFQLNLRIMLMAQVINDRNRQFACTLGTVSKNIQGFIDGDFTKGGWQAWFELTQKPQNSPYEAYLMTSSGLAKAIEQGIGLAGKKLSTGNFLSKEKCVSWASNPNGGTGEDTTPPKCLKTEVVTPGSVIEEKLNNTLDMGNRRVVIAKQLNEVLAAAINQILNMVLTDDGLKGYTYDHSIVAGQGDQPPLPEPPPGTNIGYCLPKPWEHYASPAGKPGATVTLGPSDLPDFIATNEKPFIVFPQGAVMPPGQDYTHVHATFTLKVGTTDKGKVNIQRNIFSITRNPHWNENTLVGITSGRDSKAMRIASDINVYNGERCPAYERNARTLPLIEGKTYDVTFDYDTRKGVMTISFKGLDGGGSGSVGMPTTVTMLQSNNPRHDQSKSGFTVDVGSPHSDEAGLGATGEGWEWRNFHVTFEYKAN